MNNFSGRVAVVTGAADGPKAALGAAIARELAANGAAVIVADTSDTTSVVETIVASGGTARGVHVDVSVESSVRNLFGLIDDEFGRLDVLVNNAARGSNIPPVSIEQLSVDDWDAVMAVNVRGPWLCSRYALPIMARASYGKIINMGSSTMLDGFTHRLHYVTSKGAIQSMSRALARELGPYGIRVNTVAPGLVTNDSVRETMAQRPGALEAVYKGRSIPGDVTASDVVKAVLHLASPESDAVSGQFIVVDNGGAMP